MSDKGVRSNHLLSLLPRADYARVEPFLRTVALRRRQCLQPASAAIKTIYFPGSGLLSVAMMSDRSHPVPFALIGRDGMSGLPIVLESDRSRYQVKVEIEGRAAEIEADEFRRLMAESEALRSLMLRYVHAFAIQVSQSALANARARLPERLARWLLMATDRMPDNQVHLTHETLAEMLSVRRAGVSDALQALAADQIISMSRGHICILDRRRLKIAAGEFYGVAEQEFERLLGAAKNTAAR